MCLKPTQERTVPGAPAAAAKIGLGEYWLDRLEVQRLQQQARTDSGAGEQVPVQWALLRRVLGYIALSWQVEISEAAMGAPRKNFSEQVAVPLREQEQPLAGTWQTKQEVASFHCLVEVAVAYCCPLVEAQA